MNSTNCQSERYCAPARKRPGNTGRLRERTLTGAEEKVREALNARLWSRFRSRVDDGSCDPGPDRERRVRQGKNKVDTPAKVLNFNQQVGVWMRPGTYGYRAGDQAQSLVFHSDNCLRKRMI